MNEVDGACLVAETTGAARRSTGAKGEDSVALRPARIYDLRGGADRAGYYRDAARFAERFVTHTERMAGGILDQYAAYLQDEAEEEARSRGEYALELLTLGMAFAQYGWAARDTAPWVVAVCQHLLRVRQRSLRLKPGADWLRAVLFRFAFATPGSGERKPTIRRNELPGLLDWLEATGEFRQEVIRLAHWKRFLDCLGAGEYEEVQRTSLELFAWFATEAAASLGCYTEGVTGFLETEYAARGIREDRFFCGKRPVEYFVGMVAAEVMNRGLENSFAASTRKVVLLPTCMRGKMADRCKARTRGEDLICAGCDPDCAVDRISRRLRREGVLVCMVSHASGFSHALQRWQQERGAGVVAVACLLNILAGGYEMRARGIASQCVLLDYPGCDRHWSRERVPTVVNEDRLVQITTAMRPAQGAGLHCDPR